MSNDERELFVDPVELLRKGMYSDFTVYLGEKRYLLHKEILSRCSGFFKSLFQFDPKQTEETFPEGHLLYVHRRIWDYLVCLWYKDPTAGKKEMYDFFNHQTVLADYDEICGYLSCHRPKDITFVLRRPIFDKDLNLGWLKAEKIVLRDADSNLTFSIPSLEGGPDGPKNTELQLEAEPNEEIEFLRQQLNERVFLRSDGQLVNLIESLDIIQRCDKREGLIIQVNGEYGYMYWSPLHAKCDQLLGSLLMSILDTIKKLLLRKLDAKTVIAYND